ncbi:MAG: BspA family leucine-rich repeat surface protein, partial [Algibacter sp.]|uniref:BspA family leucine-rich repeat surface protein n=1 Tax=Algibacter sp. TaxID=1872428 RepID=UPI0026377BFF
VTNMKEMFFFSGSFNQDISGWQVSNVENMNHMFYVAREFNANISGWDMSSVTDMGGMFNSAFEFNQDIGGWTTSSVTDISKMFENATVFDQDLGSWDVSQVIDATRMFQGIALSTSNYDALLLGWSAQTLQPNVIFAGGNSEFCAGVDAKQSIVDTYAWVISDRGILPEGFLNGAGNLSIEDSCGVTNDVFAISSDGNNFILNNASSPIEISGNGIVQQDDNTVLIPVSGITNGLNIDAGQGDNSITLDSSLELSGANNNLSLTNLDITIEGADDLMINALEVNDGDFSTNGSSTVVATEANFNDNATLSGDGSLSGDINMNANSNLDPGNSPGALTINGNLTLDNNNNDFEVNGIIPGTDHDQVIVNGTVTIIAGTTLNLIGGYTNNNGDEIVLIANDGTDAITGVFDNLAEGATVTIGDYNGTITYVGGDGNDFVLVGSSLGISLQPKVYLQGAKINPISGEENLMRDDLREQGLIPTTSPYPDVLTCDPIVFTPTGANAILDWVLVELRDENDNTSIIDSQSALLQRDGDVVALDGVSALSFALEAGNYFVAINHRNHLGIMSANPIGLSSTSTIVDFTDVITPTYGTHAQIDLSFSGAGPMSMLAGDADGNGVVNILGLGDSGKISTKIYSEPSNTSFSLSYVATEGYHNEDLDLDGKVLYTSGGDFTQLQTMVYTHPGNIGFSLSFAGYTTQLPTGETAAKSSETKQNRNTLKTKTVEYITINKNHEKESIFITYTIKH